jgi:hypothetical protein
MVEPMFIKLDIYMTAHELISPAYFINSPMCLYPHVVAGQRLSKNIGAVMNTHAKIEELLDLSFCMRSVSYQSKAGD